MVWGLLVGASYKGCEVRGSCDVERLLVRGWAVRAASEGLAIRVVSEGLGCKGYKLRGYLRCEGATGEGMVVRAKREAAWFGVRELYKGDGV
ncbi:unnamed protein product [Dovyalis caffra]|uniref:Uncharacterized protein n=1 Tax=Dovyalis caffra TaxID=77055 RepID=A0AAV1R0X0_9ROSI|nr:unnamed protein product [Dovyalis caffra]